MNKLNQFVINLFLGTYFKIFWGVESMKKCK
jgi:hypothetical protein